MPGDIGYQGFEFGDQFGAALHGEGRTDAHVLQGSLIVVQPEQQRADDGTALVEAVARHHTVGGPLVLDLVHGAGVRTVRQIERLGDDPVEARALVLLEPLLRHGRIGGRGSEVDRSRGIGERRLEHLAPV